MRAAVVGGGINGVMSAWALAKRGYQVTLFERGQIMGATSSASTKLLHGGIRYLEGGHFGLVREALRERLWWIEQAPHIAHRLEILLPIYSWSRRGRWVIGIGSTLYDLLSGRHSLGRSRWLPPDIVRENLPGLTCEGLRGAYVVCDGQMDDLALGQWAASQARAAGVTILSSHEVRAVSIAGMVTCADRVAQAFDLVVNAAGPWAGELLAKSGVPTRHALDLVRGSHLLVDRPMRQGVLLEVPGGSRVGFVLPYHGKTLIGTTEVRQHLSDPVQCSPEEHQALIEMHDKYFSPALGSSEILSSFAGLRPLLVSNANPNKATREYALERADRLITVFGGKWTTSRALGEKVADLATGSGLALP